MQEFTHEINKLRLSTQNLSEEKLTEVTNAIKYINSSLEPQKESDDIDYLEDGSIIFRYLALGWYFNLYLE